MKLEEGKYYRTADGKKVGPVRIKETWLPTKWALWSDGKNAYEVVGLLAEDALSTEIISEWVDHYHVFDRSDFRPKIWRDMTSEEKGALLLAEHEGKVIECWNVEEWCAIDVPYWFDDCAYRVRPEPERETVFMGICQERDKHWIASSYSYPSVGHTHRITFDLVDGKPDCASIKMERIDD